MSTHFNIVDAKDYGNATRFINHMPNQVCNVQVKEFAIEGSKLIMFFSSKDIESNKELFFNYGKQYNLEWKKRLL